MPRCRFLAQLLLMFSLAAGLSLPLAPSAAAQSGTPVASPVAVDDLYRDPAGLYTVPIPTNWTVEPGDGYITLSDPEDAFRVSAIALPEADLAAAIAAAWQVIEPGAERTPIETSEIPPPPNIDQLLVQVYDSGVESGQSVSAVGQLVDDIAYVLIFAGDLDASVRRSSQIQIIATGFEILAVDRIDLTGVKPPPLTAAKLAELEEYVETALVRHDVPGAAVAIVQNGEVVYRQGFGVRELGSDEPVTPETLMMVGSISKSMTTMMMATVVDDGDMRWDTPVVDILPSFAVADPTLSEQVTMRELVCACTGVPRRDLEFIFNAAELAPADVIASLASFEFFTPIGEAFQYSNQMVAAGGYIATLAAGGSLDSLDEDYDAAMESRVFEPIGMDSSTFSMAEAAANPNHASSHARTADGVVAAQPLAVEALLEPVAPSGLAWSNVDDMASYLLTELAEGVAPDGERVVSAANLGETWLPRVPVSSEVSYGLGWFVDSYKRQPMIQHSGNTIGFTADLAFLPEADLGIVVLSNTSLSNLFNESIRYRAFELAFDLPLEGEDYIDFALEQQQEAIAQYASTIGDAPTAAAATPFLGSYTSPRFGQVRLTHDDGRLLLDAGEFQGEVRPLRGEAASVASHALIDGPVIGLLLNLREENGQPVLEVIDRMTLEVYPFSPLDAATPVASPVP